MDIMVGRPIENESETEVWQSFNRIGLLLVVVVDREEVKIDI